MTGGPVHELWVHFEHEITFYMEFLQSWHTVHKHDAQRLVYFLARIMTWGRGKLKDTIVEKLEKIPRSGFFG